MQQLQQMFLQCHFAILHEIHQKCTSYNSSTQKKRGAIQDSQLANYRKKYGCTCHGMGACKDDEGTCQGCTHEQLSNGPLLDVQQVKEFIQWGSEKNELGNIGQCSPRRIWKMQQLLGKLWKIEIAILGRTKLSVSAPWVTKYMLKDSSNENMNLGHITTGEKKLAKIFKRLNAGKTLKTQIHNIQGYQGTISRKFQKV